MTVELIYKRTRFTASVVDDGVGLPPEILRRGKAGHWGISGMRERAAEIGAALSIRSGADVGTIVEPVVPGRLAFAN